MRAVTYPSQHRHTEPGRGVLGPTVLGAWAYLGQPEGDPYWTCDSLWVACETRCVSATKAVGQPFR